MKQRAADARHDRPTAFHRAKLRAGAVAALGAAIAGVFLMGSVVDQAAEARTAATSGPAASFVVGRLAPSIAATEGDWLPDLSSAGTRPDHAH